MPTMQKIYTRRGDEGVTALPDGEFVRKDDERVCAVGDLDELNACIGVLRAEGLAADMDGRMRQIQHDLLCIGAEVADPGYDAGLSDGRRVNELEQWLDEMSRGLPPLKAFVLPGGAKAAALCQHARAVCRRCERSLVACADEYEVDIELGRYINRLSDCLFVAALTLNKAAGCEEELWSGAAKE